jgi:hypothetical protein
MRNGSFHDEAEACRLQAALFAGKPEAHFLLRLACSFEDLAIAATSGQPSINNARRAASVSVAGVEAVDSL